MHTRRAVKSLRSIALAVLLLAPSAGAELATWDQARVSRIAKDLATATAALQQSVRERPPPSSQSAQRSYYALEHLVWLLDVQADLLVRSLQEGDGREQTSWLYEILTSAARSARDQAHDVLVTEDVGQRAAAVRGVLNELGPFYDPDFQTWSPDPRIEPAAAP